MVKSLDLLYGMRRPRTVVCLCLACLAAMAGCQTAATTPAQQPSRIIVVQGGSAGSYKQLKEELELALKAREQGERESFLTGMEKARTSAARFLSSSSRYEASQETVYQFLADRLKDAPAYEKPYSAAELARLEDQARSEGICSVVPSEGPPALDKGMDSLQPEAVKAALESMFADWGETAFAVDDVLVRHMIYFIKFFAFCEVDKTNHAIERSRRYLPYITQVFAKYGIHEDIAFALPFVESRFTTSACSPAGALGMFQFMPYTARDYGLQVPPPPSPPPPPEEAPEPGSEGNETPQTPPESVVCKDERLDWEKTATAAARYLVRSRNVFASTVLALGAYHHGSDKVISVLRSIAERSRVRSFSPIFNHGELGPYSKEYIPQCLAAAYLYRQVKASGGGRLPRFQARWQTIREVAPVAKLLAGQDHLLAFNPDLITADRIYCYASTGGYALVVGSCGKDILASPRKDVPGGSPQVQAASEPPERKKPEEEMSRISQDKEQAAADHEARHEPEPAESHGPVKEENGTAGEKPQVAGGSEHYCNIFYTFQEGNSLAELARMFGVDLRTILAHPANRRWNERYPRQPRPGDIVLIPKLAPTTAILASGPSQAGSDYRFVTVENQTIRDIARSLSDALDSVETEKRADQLSTETITPQNILYWNRDLLPQGADIDDPLPAGIPLFIVSDFRWDNAQPGRHGARNEKQGI